jgi:hypothetical protein
METYEPLTPPQIRRDENGRFDRHGRALAKTQKKTGLIKKTNENQKFQPDRLPDGRFKNGGARPGAGRPKGSPNKISQSLKEMILRSLDRVGGEEYLERLAIENSSAYSSLLKAVLPTTLTADTESGDAKIIFERVIVHPDGHREIEAKTPKQLPKPAEPIAMPAPKLSEAAAELYDDVELPKDEQRDQSAD